MSWEINFRCGRCDTMIMAQGEDAGRVVFLR
jgi:hypothetical protein